MNTRRLRTGAILSAFLSVTPALSATQDIKPVCKDGTLFLVPKSAHFGWTPRDPEKKPVEPEYLDEALLPDDWPYESPPLIVVEMHFAGFSWPKSLPGILEAFLGEKQDYAISDFIIYESSPLRNGIPFFLRNWDEAKPGSGYEGFDALGLHEGPNGKVKNLLSTEIKFFDRPFEVTCRPLPSGFSEDPNRQVCSFWGALNDGSTVRVRFHIDADSIGGWPPLDNAHETWRAPIQALEGAIANIIDQSGLGEMVCASTRARPRTGHSTGTDHE